MDLNYWFEVVGKLTVYAGLAALLVYLWIRYPKKKWVRVLVVIAAVLLFVWISVRGAPMSDEDYLQNEINQQNSWRL